MSSGPADEGDVHDPLTGAAVVGGVVVGLVVSAVATFALSWLLADLTVGFWAAVALPPLVGLVLLLVPRWRRAGAGFVLGLGVGGLVFAGVCAGVVAWIDASFGG